MAQTGKGSGAAVSAVSGKTLAQLETICEYHGWHDRSTQGEAELDNFINQTIQMLAVLAPWPEYHRVDGAQAFLRVQTTIENITGDGSTVTITATAHAVNTNDVGDITSTTAFNKSNLVLTDASANSITYEGDCQATAETSGTLTTGDQIILGESRIERLGSVWRSDLNHPLTEITLEEWLFKKRYQAHTGPPTEYAIRKFTSSGLPKIMMLVFPTPTTSITLYYPYKRYPSILSNNSDTTDWPTTRIWLLSEALVTRLKSKEKDSAGMALYSSDFMNKVNLAFNAARPSYMPIIAQGPTPQPGKWNIKDINRFNMVVTS